MSQLMMKKTIEQMFRDYFKKHDMNFNYNYGYFCIIYKGYRFVNKLIVNNDDEIKEFNIEVFLHKLRKTKEIMETSCYRDLWVTKLV